MSWYFITLKLIMWETGPTEALVTWRKNTPVPLLVTFGGCPSWNFVTFRGEVTHSSMTTLLVLVAWGFHLDGVVLGNLDPCSPLTSLGMCLAKSSCNRECLAAQNPCWSNYPQCVSRNPQSKATQCWTGESVNLPHPKKKENLFPESCVESLLGAR